MLNQTNKAGTYHKISSEDWHLGYLAHSHQKKKDLFWSYSVEYFLWSWPHVLFGTWKILVKTLIANTIGHGNNYSKPQTHPSSILSPTED